MEHILTSKRQQLAETFRSVGKWLLVALITGAVSGPLGTLFHMTVEFSNQLFNEQAWLIWLLPVAGLVIVLLYNITDMSKSAGTDEVIGSVRTGHHIRLVMAPLIFISTMLTHLFGGSAGREGAALQLGGSIGVKVGHLLKFDNRDMHIVTLCGMSALFSALFCTPLTAVFFAIEVISVGVMYYAALLPCMAASLLSYAIARLLGARPMTFTAVIPEASWDTLWRVSLLAVLCAGISIVFCLAMRESHRLFSKAFPNPYWRIAVGGVAILLLTLLSGSRDYNGSGMEIVYNAVNNGTVVPAAFLWKMLFTAVTIGCGFKGGEIVPTLFIGSTFGCVAGGLLGLDPGVAAAIAMITMLCASVNCPVACIILSIELFGSQGLLLFAPACIISYILSGNYGLYHEQRIMYSKLHAQYINRPVK
ncbi:MAG: chloride channel protein [Ruminococcaceae bacterium]|nr:chloride channel protein [Oscillospiraceae bacterium]